jgi:DNA-binding MarR family transcriptional regulator
MQSLSPASNCGSPGRCASALLSAVPAVNWFIRGKMRRHRKGLSLPQFRVLFLVEREPCASLSVVADFLGSSLPTASRIVSGLVNKGLIQRSGSMNDRRQLSLKITARGQSVLTRAVEMTQAELASEVERFTAQQRASISEAMDILKTVFGSLTSAAGKCDGAVVKPGISPSARKSRVLMRA